MKKIILISLILLVGCTKPELPTPTMPIEKIFTVTESKVTNGQTIYFDLPSSGTYMLTLVEISTGQVISREKFIGKVEKLDLTKFVSTDVFDEDDKQLLQQVRKFQTADVNKYLDRNSPFSGIWENIITTDTDELPEETKFLIAEYLHPKLKKTFEEQASNYFIFYLPQKKVFKTEHLKEIEVSDKHISPIFKVEAKNNHFEIVCMVKVGNTTIPFSDNECESSLLFLYDKILYTWQKLEDIQQAEKFLKEGNIKLSKANWAEKMQKIILPLVKDYQVEFDKSLVKEIKDTEPEIKVLLQEKGDYLLFQPIYSYKGFETKANDKNTITLPDGDKILIIHRNKEVETLFIKKPSCRLQLGF